jgi:EmrB/QacA subfamily drug resistance transporter
VITATRAGTAPVIRESRWLLPTILAATFMSALDIFIVNVAIPSLQRNLHASPGEITWVIAGFGITLAVGLIPAGRLGDRHGRRRMFALGLAVFVIASACCGLAPDAAVLIGARLVQGAGGALMGTQVLAVLRAQFSGPAQAKAFAMYGMTLGIGGVLGQLIGGLLIRANLFGLDWRTCFLINVPVGVVALAMVPRVMPESRAAQRPGLDNAGTLLLAAALVALVVPLIQGRSAGWPLWAWLSLAASAVLFVVFGAHQHWLGNRGAQPIVATVLFRDRGFTLGVSSQFLLGLVQGSYFLVLALYLQYGRGLSALASGLVVTMLGAGYLVTSTQGHRIEARLGRQAIGLGALVMAAGVVLSWVAVGHIGAAGGFGRTMWLVPGMVIQGVGMGMVITSISSRVLRAVDPRYIGSAAGVLATVLQVGGAVGVALIGVVFFGAVTNGYSHAFQVSLVALAGAQLLLAALAQFLPRLAQAR